jgi:hypothetical protein
MTMDLQVDRLTLRLAGISEEDGRRLAQLVGERLASATPPEAAGTTDAMRVTVGGQRGEALESMAERIVAEMLRGLVRTL